ncbi:MAG TPA: TIGR03013 family XrtA/PEP-CTERM system glycosyltransferase [Terriglobales bacterium]
MIRLFHVYYPIRQLVLLLGESCVILASFLAAMALQHRDDLYVALNYEGGYLRIAAITLIVLIFSHWFDLYDPTHFGEKGEFYLRLMLVPAVLALALAAGGYAFPHLLPGNNAAFVGLVILTLALFTWRFGYGWLAQQPYFRERVYVLGAGDRAQRLVNGLRARSEIGIEIVGWSGDVEGAITRDSVASHLMDVIRTQDVHRVIVAVSDRRGALPVEELLELRLGGVKVEEAASWLEKISGRIEVEQLYPSWLVFADGFRFSASFILLRRGLSIIASGLLLLVISPLIPFVILAIKIDSRGPVLYRQKRVGRKGAIFYCYKFRTMRRDAEADTGPTWADNDDPRITRIGRILRTTRLDEIPQLWCVLKGDMAFVGPRPERPEFVEWLSKEIPYYSVRHAVRPGITGWAQVRYKYGNTLGDAREKLQYDLYYIKNASIGLDLLIIFQTIKIVTIGRGAQ